MHQQQKGSGVWPQVGVEDDTGMVRLTYLGYCEVLPEKGNEAPLGAAEFSKGDWVVRNDPAYGNTEEIGEVQGLIGQAVIVKFLNDAGLASGPDYFINPNRLEHWYSSPANTFGTY